MGKLFIILQRVGKAIMLPIAVLPAAALLLRLGSPDVFDVAFIAKAGGAVFDNLPLVFAAGIAVGIAKNEAGAAALAGVVGYLSLTAGVSAFDSSLNMGVFAGIVSGLSAGILYNRYSDIKLPEFLGFFGGSRFVPIATCLLSLVFAFIFGNVWGFFQNLIQAISEWIVDAGAVGVFLYGVLNRALLPMGLHHILNSVLWFFCLEYTTENGVIATGDIPRFFAGDPTAGIFLAGFFPIIMFALPAVTLAVYHAAPKKNRKKIGGMLLSLAFTSFLTGITEPIEYMFMFTAPLLYAFHALFTGVSMAVVYKLGILHGFGFSAGFIDYVLNYGLATKPLLLIPVGIVFAIVYYAVFRYAIVKFDLRTPGRLETEPTEEVAETKADNENTTIAAEILKNLGGDDNIKNLTNCITRLRVEVADEEKVNAAAIKKLQKIKGVMTNGKAVQVIIGTEVEAVAKEIAKIREK